MFAGDTIFSYSAYARTRGFRSGEGRGIAVSRQGAAPGDEVHGLLLLTHWPPNATGGTRTLTALTTGS